MTPAGPQRHTCAGCGCAITNQPRVTMADGRVVCVRCHIGDPRETVTMPPLQKSTR